MKPCLLIVLFFFRSILPVSAQETGPAARLQKALSQDVADGQFVGAVVAYSVGEEEVIVAAGSRDVEAKLPFETSTLNRIASIAKPMTAVAALQLFEQGKLDLDEPIATYLPSYPAQHASHISTRQLLQHSSGIGEYASSKETESTHEYASLTEAATVFQDRDLVDEPGNAEHYTTYGYVVLGMVIEAVSGQSYEEYMREHVWSAAGMENTGVEHLLEQHDKKSSLYRRSKKGKMRLSDTNNLSNRVPGGGLYSNAADLLKFGQAVINHTLIKESTFDMMMEAPGLAYDGNPYGMGWFLYGDNPMVGQVYGHGGAQTGCSAVLFILPEKEAVVVVLSNTAHTMNHVFGIGVKMFPLVQEVSEEN